MALKRTATKKDPGDRIVQLHFSDPDRKPGYRFLGTALVRVPGTGPWRRIDSEHAIWESWRRGVNPGGRVQISEVDERDHSRLELYINCLLIAPEAEKLGLFTGE